MNHTSKQTTCYIAINYSNGLDPFLEARGFTSGVIAFAIPDYGILFRCRAGGNPVDLEFGAFFTLLEFVKTRLERLEIKKIQILSSNPEFVFSFTGQSAHLRENDERFRLLKEYSQHFSISVGYVKSVDNQAQVSLDACAAIPTHKSVPIKPDPPDQLRPKFSSFQRGTQF